MRKTLPLTKTRKEVYHSVSQEMRDVETGKRRPYSFRGIVFMIVVNYQVLIHVADRYLLDVVVVLGSFGSSELWRMPKGTFGRNPVIEVRLRNCIKTTIFVGKKVYKHNRSGQPRAHRKGLNGVKYPD